MSDLLPFLIVGLTTGSVYGLAGVGLVLTYKTSGIFNFAFGSIATVSAFLFYWMNDQHNVPWGVAAAVAILVLGPVLGLVLEVFGRYLSDAALAVKVAGTIGIVLVVEAGVTILFLANGGSTVVNQYLPTSSFSLAGTSVSFSDVVLIVVPLFATVSLFVYFKLTRNGLAMRAVVDNADLLDLAGTPPIAIRRRSWIIGTTFACACGVLLAPSLPQIDGLSITLLVITAFGAAAIGSFTSLPLTYVGGLVIGVIGSFATKYFTSGFLSQLPVALPFVILFLVLVFSSRNRLKETSKTVIRNQTGWSAPLSLQGIGGIPILAFLCLVPMFAGVHLADWTTMLADVILFLSLGLLVRMSGQVSLCQMSFVAIGAIAFSHLTTSEHLPWLVALAIAGLIAMPIGAVLAIPAIRQAGLYLALATLGFGIVLQYMFYTEGFMFGPNNLGSKIPRPHLSWLNVSSDTAYYYVVLLFALLTTVFVVVLKRGRLGRLLRAMSASPTGLATSGTSVNVTRVLIFCLAAFLAAVSGALAGSAVGEVSATSYPAFDSVLFFALIMISVGGEPWYAVLAAASVTIVPSYIQGTNVTNYLTLLFGIGAITYAIAPSRGVPVPVRRWIDSIFRSQLQQPASAPDAVDRVPGVIAPASPGGLRVQGVTVQFGGLVAARNVTLDVPTGRITALIGPNGAGKTTTFNVCSGLGSATSGRVILDERDISRLGPAARSRLGLGRTFQQMELFDTMSVRDNIALGQEGQYAGTNPVGHVVSTPRQREVITRATDEALSLVGLLDVADVLAGNLSTGRRRLVELGRCLVGGHSILLLDEPSSGLDHVETERFGEILQSVVADRGVGILLVEHDMSLVTEICDHIYVLDFGEMVFEGSSREVVGSPVVRAAYLGEEIPELWSEGERSREAV